MLEGIFRYNYTWRFKNPLLPYVLILMVEAASTYWKLAPSITRAPSPSYLSLPEHLQYLHYFYL